MSSSAPGNGDLASELAHALMGRLARARTLGDLGEAFPLVVDEPFRSLDPGLKVPLLELLARSEGSPQVILLTADEEVASWARLEALTGTLAVLEPAPDAEPAHANGVA
jgi:ABC-type thiamine transport system ATPase subunit